MERENYYVEAHREMDAQCAYAIQVDNLKDRRERINRQRKEMQMSIEIYTAKNGLTFEPEGHIYKMDGRRLPSLTQILDAAGFIDYSMVPLETLKAKAAFGTRVHEYCLWIDQDEIGIEELKPYPAYESRVLGWMDFVKDYDLQADMEWAERPMAVKINGCTFALTPDRYGMSNQGPCVVEIKCSVDLMPAYALQTAAQVLPFRNELNPTVKRFVCQLLDKPNGSGKRYFAKEYTDRTDEKIFLAALATTQWRINNKLFKTSDSAAYWE